MDMAKELSPLEQELGNMTIAYPALRNPTVKQDQKHMNMVSNSQALQLMNFFNEAYYISMSLMAIHFKFQKGGSLRRSRLMNASIDFMTAIMRPVGTLLMSTPSGIKGKTAGPSFELPRTPNLTGDFKSLLFELADHCEQLTPVAYDLMKMGLSKAPAEFLIFYVKYLRDLGEEKLSRYA